jgi:hypothetical protein
MFLKQTRILYRSNERSLYSGIDCYEHAYDKEHFLNYPHEIAYNYNSRGFRDQEWPESFEELQNSIWCIGDSFTAGVGVPREHTWPYLLNKATSIRTINVSLDGASNNWMARHAQMILTEIKPKFMVIHWSFSHRREMNLYQLIDPLWKEFYQAIRDPQWPDCNSELQVDHLPEPIRNEVKSNVKFDSYTDQIDTESDRRVYETDSTPEQDLANTQQCIDAVVDVTPKDTVVVHSFIPKWHNKQYALNFYNCPAVDPINPVDLGRDGYHYDIDTAQLFVDQLSIHFKSLSANTDLGTSL